MSNYGYTIDRLTWEYICYKIAEKSKNGSIYGCFRVKMQPRRYGEAKAMAAFSCFCGLFGDTQIDRNTISIRWCECFEIPNYRGRKNYIVHMAKIERYILPKACIKRAGGTH